MIPSIGAGDLHPPFPNITPHPLPINNPSNGNLMGPDHPIFQPNYPDYNGDYPDYNTGGSGADYPWGPEGPNIPGWMPGLPRPRFDPFGPVPGPNGPFMGGRGGRGRGGRGMGGGPNPDHLRPPNFEWNN